MTRSVEDFLGGYRPPKVSVKVTQRADLLAEHSRLQAAHAVAIRDDMSLNRAPEAPAVTEQIRDIESEIAASEFEFEFQAVGRHEYLKLLAQHKPRRTDRDQNLDFNAETFPPALIAASAVDPTISEEQAAGLLEHLSDGQFAKLWNAAITVNVGNDAAPKSVTRSGSEARTDGSSTTAPPEGSLAASSSGE